MYNFETHNDVPKQLKDLLLETEGIESITDYSIVKINSLLNEIDKHSKELNKYTNYEIEYQQDKQTETTKIKFNNLEDVYVCMDRVTDYGKRKDITLLFTQAGRAVRGYSRGEWIYPQNLYDR